MEDGQQENTSIPIVALEKLVIEVSTLTIHGKKIKPALLRQFVTESLIDATGPTLRGSPLAWHTLHEKQCASLPPHIHLIWRRGSVYRVALILDSWEQEPCYEQHLESLNQHAADLTDLLALVLAQDERYDSDALNDDKSREEQNLEIGEYTLPLSHNTCYLLRKLEEARHQRDQDESSLVLEERDGAIQQARQVRGQLLDLGIILGHPLLDAGLDDPTLYQKTYGSFSDDDLTDALASVAGRGKKERPVRRASICWDWKWGQRDGIAPPNLGELLRDNEPGLLAVISDLIVQNRLREVQRKALSLAEKLGVEFTDTMIQKSLEGSILSLALSAERVWNLCQEAERRCEEYPQALQHLYEQLHALEQIFIDG